MAQHTSPNWVSFAEVRARVSIEQVLLNYYGLTNLRRENGNLVGPCPVHGGDSPRAFRADTNKNTWYCHTKCKAGGNQLDLVAAAENITVREAALKLQAFFQLKQHKEQTLDHGSTLPHHTPSTAQPSETSLEPNEPNQPLSLELELLAEHPHLTDERELSPTTIAEFGLGYVSKGTLRGCIAIPIHNGDGQLAPCVSVDVALSGPRTRAVKESGALLGEVQGPDGPADARAGGSERECPVEGGGRGAADVVEMAPC